MKSTFVVAMPVMVAVGALANAHTNMHLVRDTVSGAAPQMPKSGAFTPQGCYSAAPNMTDAKLDSQYLSSGSCNGACVGKKYLVSALTPQSCYCGNTYPPEDMKIDLAKCNYPCNGFGQEACGGIKDAYSVFNLGIDLSPDTYVDPSSSSASATSTKASSSTTAATTATPTQTPGKETSTPEKSSGPNTAAIAAGVVVGVVVAAAIIGGIVFFMRRKRNAEIEEEHRRNAAVNAFISGSKPPSSSGGISITDSRLDPVMAHRRLSDGSIADNQDYSRKILRVRSTS